MGAKKPNKRRHLLALRIAASLGVVALLALLAFAGKLTSTIGHAFGVSSSSVGAVRTPTKGSIPSGSLPPKPGKASTVGKSAKAPATVTAWPSHGHGPAAAGPDPKPPPAVTMSDGTRAQQSAALGLWNAWKSRDSRAAATYATDAVVSQLFESAWQATDNPLGCTLTPTATLVCNYGTANGEISFYVNEINGHYKVDALGNSPY